MAPTESKLDPWAELQRLEVEEPANIAAARRDIDAEEKRLHAEGRDLYRQLERLRYVWVREGQTPERELEMAEVDARMKAIPVEQQRIDDMRAAIGRAHSDVQAQKEQLLKDHLKRTFLPAALKQGEEAVAKLRALAPAVAEAAQAWQQAAREFERIRKALTETLRERDLAAGIDRPGSYYANAVKLPPFPIPSALGVPCRPPAADLLKQPPTPERPREMRRVA
jgi:hypothetical protein